MDSIFIVFEDEKENDTEDTVSHTFYRYIISDEVKTKVTEWSDKLKDEAYIRFKDCVFKDLEFIPCEIELIRDDEDYNEKIIDSIRVADTGKMEKDGWKQYSTSELDEKMLHFSNSEILNWRESIIYGKENLDDIKEATNNLNSCIDLCLFECYHYNKYPAGLAYLCQSC